MTFSERLRKCVEIAGSGDKLARKSAIPRRSLEYYLSGESYPKADRLEVIVKATGVNGHWLLTGEGTMLPNEDHSAEPQMLGHVNNTDIDTSLLQRALVIVEEVALNHGISLSVEKRAKLAGLAYQYTMLVHDDEKVSTYLSQLIELIDLKNTNKKECN